jgi:hypothetical protein
MNESVSTRIITKTKFDMEKLQTFLRWVEAHAQPLDSLPFEPSFWNGQCDFDNLTHDKVLLVMQTFAAGHWDKTLEGVRVNYETIIDGMIVCCWHGEPPPSCKIVEERVLVPLVPERWETVRKLVCPKGEAL